MCVFPVPGLHVASKSFKPRGESPESSPWLFNNWRAEAARIAAGMYDIDLDRVPKEYLWRLFGDDVSPWEVAELCQNVIAAQEDRLLKG